MGGRYKAYTEYKESGVSWLSVQPNSWSSTQVKYGFGVTLGKMLQNEPKDKSFSLKPYLKAANIQQFGIDISKVDFMWFSITELKSLRLKTDDLLISEGGDVGRSALWNDELEECYIQNAINRARALKRNSTKFLFYWMQFLKNAGYIDILCNKATIAHYTAEKVQATLFFKPSYDEQEKIASFLDHETAKIDTLIAKQEKLIDLLKEKRQAVISHAVTKGLNPNAPMKDSGVEWLGVVPEHWTIVPIKQLAELTPKKSQISGLEDRECSFVPMEKLKQDRLVLDESRKLKEVYNGYTYFENEDILLAKVTPCFENKNMVIARNLVNGIGFGSSEIYVIRCTAKVYNEFLYFRLQESLFMNFAIASMSGAGGLKRVPSDVITNFTIALPALHEQLLIIDAIKRKISRIDDLLDKANVAIGLIKERKSALISAAVTGKIDVRDWQGLTEAKY